MSRGVVEEQFAALRISLVAKKNEKLILINSR